VSPAKAAAVLSRFLDAHSEGISGMAQVLPHHGSNENGGVSMAPIGDKYVGLSLVREMLRMPIDGITNSDDDDDDDNDDDGTGSEED